MLQESSQKLERMAQPSGAIEVMRDLAERLIVLRVERARTREKAIQEITKEQGFGTWLRRLVYGASVADSASNLCKLTLALERELTAAERRRENDRAIVRAIRSVVV